MNRTRRERSESRLRENNRPRRAVKGKREVALYFRSLSARKRLLYSRLRRPSGNDDAIRRSDTCGGIDTRAVDGRERIAQADEAIIRNYACAMQYSQAGNYTDRRLYL